MPRVRVISFNTRHGAALDGRHALAEQTELLRGVLAGDTTNVVMLQECDRWTRRSGGTDQPGVVAQALGLTCHFGGNINYQDGEYGTAILTDAKVEESFHDLLPMTASGELRHIDGTVHRPERRGLIGTRVAGTLFVCVHASLWPEERQQMTETLLDLVGRDGRPVVIAGDFNTDEDREYDALNAVLEDPLSNPGAKTFPAGTPVARIDRILTRGPRHIASGTVVTEISDHHLIWADLEY